MKWHFRTLGMGSINYRFAAGRLAKEAELTQLFESSIGFNERHFQLIDPIFWADHKKVLHARVPGFGWWVWKPYFILNSLLSLPEGDGLLYLDAGSVIKSDGESLTDIKRYMALASNLSILGSNSDFFQEDMYTSMELLNYLNLNDRQRRESQFCAAILFIVNNEVGRAFMRDWCRIVCTDDHRWLLPIHSENEIKSHFKNHMYDQSSFSCLIKSYNGGSIPTGNRDYDGAIRLARHRFGYKFQESRSFIVYPFKMLGWFNRYNLAVQRRLFKKSLSLRPDPHELHLP